MICPNVICDNKRATLIDTESPTIIIKRIYKCEKCGSTWNTFERVDASSFIKGNLTKEENK